MLFLLFKEVVVLKIANKGAVLSLGNSTFVGNLCRNG